MTSVASLEEEFSWSERGLAIAQGESSAALLVHTKIP